MVNKTKYGFTLAEVLITLVIIGIVAAITIPTVINNTKKQEYVSRLKKTYSALSQATNLIMAEEGSPKASIGGWASSAESIFNMYKKYLSNAIVCTNGSVCQYSEKIKDLNTPAEYNLGTSPKLILADGTLIDIPGGFISNDCSGGSDETAGIYRYCGVIFVDVNGARKPNTWGRDSFQFLITENGLKPRGCGLTFWPNCFYQGHACACKVLQEGAINY